MKMSKRDFISLSGASAGALAMAAVSPKAFSATPTKLSSITGDVVPISVEERLARIAKAQRLMADNNIDAILLEPGSAMLYFSGVSWWRSERLTTVIIPREGEIGVVDDERVIYLGNLARGEFDIHDGANNLHSSSGAHW